MASSSTDQDLRSRIDRLAKAVVVVISVVALYPVADAIWDWIQVSRVVDSPRVEARVRSYDWIVWRDNDGRIEAAYIHDHSPAAAADLREGDVFYTLDYQMYFNTEALQSAKEGVAPGERLHYSVLRNGEPLFRDVPLTRYPTFLYPLSNMLWTFSLWGFLLAAFIHFLGFTVALPLAARSTQARNSLILIAVSGLWIVGNLVRIIAVELMGPPSAGTRYDSLFSLIAWISLIGWVAFPVLLVNKVVGNAFRDSADKLHLLLWLAPAVLGAAAVIVVARGSLGPVTMDDLIAPILFYASCYIALAAGLVLFAWLKTRGGAEPFEWNVTGSAITLVVAIAAALVILGVVPFLTQSQAGLRGWFVVATQLLSTAPVILVSLATLRYGKLDSVLRQSLGLVAGLGALFFLFVGGMGLMEGMIEDIGASRNIIAGLYAVLLVFLIQRAMKYGSRYIGSYFPSDRQRTARMLGDFHTKVREVVDFPTLVRESIGMIGEAFGARSAILYMQSPTQHDTWISSTYHPEAPYLTESFLRTIWPILKSDGAIWTYNPALNRSDMPGDVAKQLIDRGAAVAVPIVGREEPIGVIVLGRKKSRRAVYNLEEIERLRSLSGQLALAAERVHLVERQKLLAQENTQAQLVALRSQINPHFLFNALNTINALIEEKPDDAEDTVDHLASIFRHILQARDRDFITLDDELALVRHYLSIEQARFGDKLTVEIDVPPELRSFPIPAFTIQTLVENAVKHGIEKQLNGGAVRLACADHTDHVEVTVTDTGIGIPVLFDDPADNGTPTKSYFGIGLKNVSVRLEQLYQRADLFELRSSAGVGTVATLKFPKSRIMDVD